MLLFHFQHYFSHIGTVGRLVIEKKPKNLDKLNYYRVEHFGIKPVEWNTVQALFRVGLFWIYSVCSVIFVSVLKIFSSLFYKMFVKLHGLIHILIHRYVFIEYKFNLG